MYYQTHMPPGSAPPPQPAQYHNPPLLHPASQYQPPPYASQYAYANGMTSPPTGGPVGNPMGGAGNVLPLPSVPTQPGLAPSAYNHGFDTTGQVAPAGMKPRVTATLWEDEGSLCFQVEARGICVARREG
jgi:protein SOK2